MTAIADIRTDGGNSVRLCGRWEGSGSRARDGRIKGREVRTVGGERVQRVSDGIGDVRTLGTPRKFSEQTDRLPLSAMCARQ